jgi:hypothetical protein
MYIIYDNDQKKPRVLEEFPPFYDLFKKSDMRMDQIQAYN